MTSHDRQQLHETAQNTDDDQSTSYQLDENGDPLGWADTQRPSPEWSESEKLFGPSPIEGALAAVLWLGASVLFSWYVAHFGSYNKT